MEGVGCGVGGGEVVVRKIWFRHYTGGTMDRLFARAFPPERTANGRRSLDYAELRAASSPTSGRAETC